MTIGLVGLGSIGYAVARFSQAIFSARFLAYDPFVSVEVMAAQGVEKREHLLDMVPEVDILSLHVSLTPETRHLVDEAVLRAMKPGAYLINTARGAVVDERALIKALQERWIAGAATDVFEEEPLKPENPLLKMSNVIVTPHIAGVTVQASAKRYVWMVKRMLEAFAGKRPEGLINPEVWPKYLEKTREN
jgi:phosphoglycerate dehydrogenase-like enzyme